LLTAPTSEGTVNRLVLIITSLMSVLTIASGRAHAEDIDLYTGGSSGGDPNVLFVLDNESNWDATMDSNPPADADSVAGCGGNTGSYFCAQKYALIQLLQKTDATGAYFVGDNVGIGVMMYGSGSNKGGYIRFGIRRLTAQNRAALIKLLKAMPVSDKGSSTQDFGYMMWEAFKYFGGGTGIPWSSTTWGPIPLNGVGVGTDARDYPSNATVGSAYWAGADVNYAYTTSLTVNSGASPTRYVPPTHASDCGKNYVVYIGHSNSQSNTNNNQDAQALFIGVGGSTTQVNPGSGSSGDEGARYLFNSDVDPTTPGTQNVITYTIGTYQPPANGQVSAMITTMKSMAKQGGGSYYDATSISSFADALSAIMTEVQGTNSVFVSAALPISVNTQGTFLNQIFVGMFRPDPSGSPKWLGNLKQYLLKYDSATKSVRLADADGLDAIDSATGFVSVLSRSFWTTTSSFWTNWVPGKTTSVSDSKDGPEVFKGGAAQRERESNLTTQSARKVYTCAVDTTGAPNCVPNSLLPATPFDTTTLLPSNAGTQAAFNYPGAWTSTTTASTDIGNLIAWVRGTDNLGNELGPGGTTTVRPTIHGDVLHSRPVALNYGGSPPRVVVFYGANDGMLRAIDGRQTTSGAGNELWTFVAPETFNKLHRLREETPRLVLPSAAGANANNKDYFMDGPIGAYQEGSSAIIYVAARRGGKFIYAIDVSDPDNPRFKFKLSTATSGLSNLGQTWSMPKVTKVRDGTANGKVVLIFGGGYDVAEDSNTVGTTGRGVYVVDALTGTVLKVFSSTADGLSMMSASVPSDVTIANTDRDAQGFTDRAYVGDLAGNVWRMDLDNPASATNDPAGWKLHKLASLGARKFFYPPDVVFGASFHAVLIGSGDREKPLALTSSDRFYMIKDSKVGLDGSGQTTIVEADLVPNTSDSTAAKGWYYSLNTSGEKVVNAPLTIGGVVYFGTNRPIAQTACKADLGESRSYAMSFLDGSGQRAPDGVGTGDDPYSEVLTGGGLPPSPIAGLVDIGGIVVPVCLGCGERRSAFEAGSPTISPNPVRRKLYWKFKNDK
jgi:type IV pilus assembly protein PilY1